jgi:hypothetical protein
MLADSRVESFGEEGHIATLGDGDGVGRCFSGLHQLCTLVRQTMLAHQ